MTTDHKSPDLLPCHRRQIDRAIQEAESPRGMSVHDGKARIDAALLRRLVALVDRQAAAPDHIVDANKKAAAPSAEPVATIEKLPDCCRLCRWEDGGMRLVQGKHTLYSADTITAAVHRAVQDERERCAVLAWDAGMAAHNAALGLPCDAREVGSAGAAAIRGKG